MPFNISRHAQDELQRRGIPRSFLDAVLQNPQQIVPTPDGKQAYQSQIDFGGGRIFLLRAIVATDVDPPLVVKSIAPARSRSTGGHRESHL